MQVQGIIFQVVLWKKDTIQLSRREHQKCHFFSQVLFFPLLHLLFVLLLYSFQTENICEDRRSLIHGIKLSFKSLSIEEKKGENRLKKH